MVLFQPWHSPACTIKQGLKMGYAPSIRMLDLGTCLWKHFNKNGIKTVRDLALLGVDDVRGMLSGRKYVDKDVARIKTALKNVDLELGMTEESFEAYYKKNRANS